MPAAVCAVPAVVMVSLTEAEADYEAKTDDLPGWMSGCTYVKIVAWAKVLAKNRMGKVHSAHLARYGTKEVCIHRYALQRAYDRTIQHHLRVSDPHVRCEKLVCRSGSADLYGIDLRGIERHRFTDDGYFIEGRFIRPDSILRRLVTNADRPIGGVTLEWAMARMMGLLHEIDANIGAWYIINRSVI
jgi:hypothetical protein